MRQIGSRKGVVSRDHHVAPERRQRVQGGTVAIWNRCQNRRRALDQRSRKLLLRPRVERHIEQHDWQARPSHAAVPASSRGGAKQGRAIVHGRPRQRFLETLEQSSQIVIQRLGTDRCEAQFVDGSRERFRKSGHRRHGAEGTRVRPPDARRTPRGRRSPPIPPASRQTRLLPPGNEAAARAANSVKLKRISPKVAPARDASARTRSSAAPRDAPMTTRSLEGG